MKKLILFCLLFISVNAKAMDKNELYDVLTKEYIINGEKFQVSDDIKVLVERYLNNNELMSSDMNYISNKVNSIIEIIDDSDVKDIKNLNKDDKNKIINIVKDVANKIDIKVTISDDNISIYNKDGSLFVEMTELIKYTDDTNYIVYISGTIVLLGIIYVVRKLRYEK